MVDGETIVQRIRQAMPSAEVRTSDLTGGGDHWRVTIRANEFQGKSLVEQHQMVYRALGELMQADIHALSLDTKEK